MTVTHLDGPMLRRWLLAGASWVDAGRDELNRINVFPVPDGDTGTNFSLTLRGVADAVLPLRDPNLPTVAHTMADACVVSAHGNSGMLLSSFLLGFRDAIADHERATPLQVAQAIRSGADRLYAALDDPVEGTILTVCRTAADAAEEAAPTTSGLGGLMTRVLAQASTTLARTPEMLAALREAGVVDAGGKGFVRLLEGIVRVIEGELEISEEPPEETARAPAARPMPAATAAVHLEHDYRFCTEVVVRGRGFPSSAAIRNELRSHGGSIVALATGQVLKIHIHTNDPQAVTARAAAWGRVEDTKVDDVREQHRALSHPTVRTIAIVVDSTCDLPAPLVDRYDITVVPIQISDGHRTYRDGIDITADLVYDRMRRDRTAFSTSQPAPGAFVDAYREASRRAHHVLCLTLASALSGTWGAARTAVDVADVGDVTVVDSRTVSIGLGMLVLRAAELAEAGWDVPAIVEEVTRIGRQSGSLITVDTFDHLLRSGRVGRGRAWLGTLLDVKPIITVDPSGRVAPVDRVRGRSALPARVISHLEARLPPHRARLRLGIVHADCPDVAARLRDTLKPRFHPIDCFVTPATATLGVHAGPGAWGVFYQLEDDAPTSRNTSADGRL